MAWTPLHQELPGHPKTRKLARRLGLDTATTVGHLVCLWLWALGYAVDGDLSSFDADEIAIGAEWGGDADEFVGALLDARFLDEDRTMHDWHEYGGKLHTLRMKQSEGGKKGAARRWGMAPDDGEPNETPSESPNGGTSGSPNGSSVGVDSRQDNTRQEDIDNTDKTRGGATAQVVRATLIDEGHDAHAVEEAIRQFEGRKANGHAIKSPINYVRSIVEAQGGKTRQRRGDEDRRPCPGCGKVRMLVDTDDGPRCVDCVSEVVGR